MKLAERKRALAAAMAAARAAGQVMRRNQWSPKTINTQSQHDIKLELDVRCQTLIEQRLARAFPLCALLGEEGVAGDAAAPGRWVVDPIDGTVNFAYGIPHASVSIALQIQNPKPKNQSVRGPAQAPAQQRGMGGNPRAAPSSSGDPLPPPPGFETVVGVVYDPFCDEMWTAIRGQPARLNGRLIQVSQRRRLAETVISLGFGKQKAVLEHTLPAFNRLVYRVRKLRIMGSAALALTYVACGRFDAYVESGVRLWDIAAGGLIVECAGGEFWHRALPEEHAYAVNANNGRLRRQLERFVPPPA